MNLGISWNAYGEDELTIEEQICLLKKYNFTNVFLDSEDKNFYDVVKSLHESGIIIDTCHAPFDGINYMWIEGSVGDNTLKRLYNSVDRCSDFNIPVIIVHLSSGDNCPHITDIGYDRFKRLVDYSVSKNVKIAFENQRKLANISFAMEEFPEAGFCWDVGHEKCFAYGREYMPLFSSRLVALHIHDNFMVHNEDRHMIPFDASIDYNRTAELIAKSGYNGTIMLELMRHTSGYYEDVSPDEYYLKASKAAFRIYEMIQSLRL